MKYILIPLFFLIIIAVGVQIYNLQPIDYSNYNGIITSPNTGQQIQDLGVASIGFNLTLMVGFIALFTAVAAAGIAAGLNISVLGSTVQISQRAQNILFNSMFYGGLWGIFSTLATVGINGLGLFSIPVFGALFYIMLTLIYVLGINQQIQHDMQG